MYNNWYIIRSIHLWQCNETIDSRGVRNKKISLKLDYIRPGNENSLNFLQESVKKYPSETPEDGIIGIFV